MIYQAIVTDIEGTTTPISFVKNTLFPYAAARMANFLAENPDLPEIAEAARLAGNRPVLEALHAWMAEDAKITPLKSLQGRIWNEGYRTGDLHGDIYQDVPPILRQWHAAGIALHIYSSGSIAAQRLLFAHSTAGDLTPFFTHYFDTTTGPKRDPASYRAIAQKLALPPEKIFFLSDMEPELDAAATAGLATTQLVRPGDGTVPSPRHLTAATFADIAT